MISDKLAIAAARFAANICGRPVMVRTDEHAIEAARKSIDSKINSVFVDCVKSFVAGSKFREVDETPIDGSGLYGAEYVQMVADQLALNDDQKSVLCSLLGNVLVVAQIDAEHNGATIALKQIEVLFALQRALSK